MLRVFLIVWRMAVCPAMSRGPVSRSTCFVAGSMLECLPDHHNREKQAMVLVHDSCTQRGVIRQIVEKNLYRRSCALRVERRLYHLLSKRGETNEKRGRIALATYHEQRELPCLSPSSPSWEVNCSSSCSSA